MPLWVWLAWGEARGSWRPGKGSGAGANARIAARGLDQGVAGLDAAALLGLLDHAQGYPVLDAAAGVEELDLGVDVALEAQRLRDAVELDERRVADELRDGAHGGGEARCLAHGSALWWVMLLLRKGGLSQI